MKIIDPTSEIAETVFYQQFMTEMYAGLEKLKPGLSEGLINNIGEDVQYIAFKAALKTSCFEIHHDEKSDKYSLVDLLGEKGNNQRLCTAFSRISNKLSISAEHNTGHGASEVTLTA
jgi:hypothetical protein